ncbi:MAG: TIGR01459 family HAD-type hydrolase [Dongiaceae bacterium]
MSARASTDVQLISGLSEVAEPYDGFILDLWGVLHDGVKTYPGALACLHELRRLDKRVAILSNAPRRSAAVAERCAELGITPDLYRVLHSSGEDAWRHLDRRPDSWYAALGRRAYAIAPARDHGLFENLDLMLVDDCATADFVVVTGTTRGDEQVADFESILRRAVQFNLPMICANPDLEVVRDGVREICAGAIAARYQALGGFVRYHGKPDPAVYQACLNGLDHLDKARVLAIGDSLRTDIAGAVGSGLDSLFVIGGIHGAELVGPNGPDANGLAAAFGRAGQWPTYAMASFVW